MEELSRGKRESDIAFSETLKKSLSAIDPEVMAFSFSIFRKIKTLDCAGDCVLRGVKY